MQIDVDHEPPWPGDRDWPALAERAAAAAARVAPELADHALAVSILLTSDAEVRALNREWRGKDRATNVLSFPMLDRADLLLPPAHAPVDMPRPLGDIALAFETCMREAEDRGIAVDAHAAHLIVHGLLHLAGYDHEMSEAAATAMEALETKALALIGIADPYGHDVRHDDKATGA